MKRVTKTLSLVLISAALCLQGCTGAEETNTETASTEAPSADVEHNTLTAEEKAEGWMLLFDGEDFDGWSNYNKETIGKNWVIDQQAIHLNAENKEEGDWQAADGGDIVYEEAFENYELRLDWKIGECGNSGIIFNVKESPEIDYPWQTGPEMQVLDNTCHPDAKITTHKAGDLYDLIESSEVTVKPAGEWNSIRLIVNDGHLEQWQNGVKVVETEMWTPEWKEMIANSKFKDMPLFGTVKKGKIALQDHGDPVWFRNIMVKKLDPM
jgi:cytochrome c